MAALTNMPFVCSEVAATIVISVLQGFFCSFPTRFRIRNLNSASAPFAGIDVARKPELTYDH
jgi:hypothetical protein